MTTSTTLRAALEAELIKRAIVLLQEGADRFASSLAMHKDLEPLAAAFRESSLALAQCLKALDKQPPEQIRDTAGAHLISIYQLVRQGKSLRPWGESLTGDSVAFLREAAVALGPPLWIEPDAMAVHIRIPSAAPDLWTPALVKDSLRRRGIVQGIDEEAIQAIFQNKQFDQDIGVARGKEPTAGRPGRIEDELNLFGTTGIPAGSGGRADLKPQILFIPVKKGQAVFRKIPATEGEPGMDVFGSRIPALWGEEAELPAIRNCAVDLDRTGLFSLVEGFAYVEGGQVIVTAAEIIRGNVNTNSGDIKSPVSVYVHGNVLSDFAVEAGEDIAVRGMIEQAAVRAQGTVFCRGGIYGKGKAVLQTGKHVLTTYVQGTRIQAGGDVVVRGPIIESEVSARRIVSEGPNGQIVGGKLEAWEDICAVEIGSEAGTPTELFLGNELPGLRETVEHLRSQLQAKEDEKDRLLQSAPDEELPNETSPLPLDDRKRPVEEAILNLDKERETLLKKIKQASRDLTCSEGCARMVRARRAIHPGTVIHILGETWTASQRLGPSTILFTNGNWVILPYFERVFEDPREDSPA